MGSVEGRLSLSFLKERLRYVRLHKNCTENLCQPVWWLDGSRFDSSSNCHQYVQRRSGERCHSDCVQNTVEAPSWFGELFLKTLKKWHETLPKKVQAVFGLYQILTASLVRIVHTAVLPYTWYVLLNSCTYFLLKK